MSNKFKVAISINNTHVEVKSTDWDVISQVVSFCTSDGEHNDTLKDEVPRKMLRRTANDSSRIAVKTELSKPVDKVVKTNNIDNSKNVSTNSKYRNYRKKGMVIDSSDFNDYIKGRMIPIMCVTDNKQFESISATIRHYGYNYNQIIHSCINEVPIGTKNPLQFKFI